MEFSSAGPKNSGYVSKEGKVECKVRSFTLNARGHEQLNFELLKTNVIDEVTAPLNEPRVLPPPQDSSFLHFFISSFLHFFISSFLHFFISSFLHFFISSFLHFFISSFLHFFISSFLHFFISSFLHFFISSFLSFFLDFFAFAMTAACKSHLG